MMNKQTFTAMKAMIKRDILIQLRDRNEFIFRVAMLPFILIFIYGFVLPTVGAIPPSLPEHMFPGMIGMSLLVTGIHGTAIPLTMDFNMSREIEDRLQAPIATRYIAMSKMIVGMIESWIGAALVLPISLIFMWKFINIQLGFVQIIQVIIILLLASIASASLGLLVGTIVKPNQIAAMFPGFLMPLVFTGAIFFTWKSLAPLPIVQYLFLLNPLVYINEALRTIMYPTLDSMNIWVCLIGIIGFSIVMFAFGYKRFKAIISK